MSFTEYIFFIERAIKLFQKVKEYSEFSQEDTIWDQIFNFSTWTEIKLEDDLKHFTYSKFYFWNFSFKVYLMILIWIAFRWRNMSFRKIFKSLSKVAKEQ